MTARKEAACQRGAPCATAEGVREGRTVEREDGAAERVEVRPLDELADVGEEEREDVEDDVVLGVLLQRLDGCALDGPAREPDGALDDDRANHGRDGDGREVCLLEVPVAQSLDRLDEDLEEARDHGDGEDEDAERFHPVRGEEEESAGPS